MNGALRVLTYSHDGFGLGHLRRNLRIVNGLRQRYADVEALVVTGAKSAGRIVRPFALPCVLLPPVTKVNNGLYVADGSDLSLREVIRARSAMIVDAVNQFKPDLLLADRYPNGLRDELAPALAVHAAQSGTTAVLGLRDILDNPASIRQEWQRRGHSDTIRDHYKTVLCYGDPNVYNPISEYGLCRVVAERVHFTGYLADDLLPRDPLSVRRAHCTHERLVVCALGGGKDAAQIPETFLSAMERLRKRGWDGVLIAGPYMTADDFTRLTRHPAARFVHVHRMVEDLPSYLAAADAAVCMGGYNTICELLGLSVPAVIIPRIQPRQEQIMRTERLAARQLLWWLHPDRCSASNLAQAIETVAAVGRDELAARIRTIAHGGIATAAEHLGALLAAEHRPAVGASARPSPLEVRLASA